MKKSKKSKKSKFKKKLKIAYWGLFVLGCLWIAFVPSKHVIQPPSVTVKVEQVPEVSSEAPAPTASEGEEQSLQQPYEETQPPRIINTPEPQEQGKAHGKIKIALVIDDVGVDIKGSEKAISLPPAVTLSFLPYAVRLRELSRDALDQGHELLLHMPMEPIGHENPGPGALLTSLPMDELQQRFEHALASFGGFDGMNNHMGSKFTAWQAGMEMVADELQQRNLFYLDSRTSVQSVGLKVAQEKGVPTIARDVFLDDDQAPEYIRKQLDIMEHVARRKGYAVAIGHPHETTMAVLAKWTAEAPGRGIELVPLKSLVQPAPLQN